MPGLVSARERTYEGRDGVVFTYHLTALSPQAGSFRARNATRARFPRSARDVKVISAEEMGTTPPQRRKRVEVEVFLPVEDTGVARVVTDMVNPNT